MIDPANITNYNRNQWELEEFLIFCVLVAGKPAFRTARQLDKLIAGSKSPLNRIAYYISRTMLLKKLKKHGFGQYSRITKCLKSIIASELNLRTCTIEDLEAIHGIGPKTARFFILHSRPNQDCAVLDTHVLRYMREKHGIKTPKTTPSGQQYARLENEFLQLANSSGMAIADFDLWIWNQSAKGAL